MRTLVSLAKPFLVLHGSLRVFLPSASFLPLYFLRTDLQKHLTLFNYKWGLLSYYFLELSYLVKSWFSFLVDQTHVLSHSYSTS